MNRLCSSLMAAALGTASVVHGQSPFGQLGSGKGASETPPQLQNVEIKQKLKSQVPLDLRFKDDAGRDVRFADLLGKGRPAVLTLVYYTCPRLCTMELNGFVRSAKGMPFDIGEEYDVITVSFDPADTPATAVAKKAGYLEAYGRPGAKQNWHFLTGDKRNIELLSNAVGFKFDYDDQTKQYSHASALILLTPQGKVSKYFFGIEYPVRDLRLALVEAGEGKIGGPIDNFLMYCFHYDPATGRYSLAVMRTVQTMAGISVLALAGYIAANRRRDRQREGRA